MNKSIGLIAVLLAANVSLANDKDQAAGVAESNGVVLGKALADSANRAAASDAIESLLIETRQRLEISFADRTTETPVDGD